MVRETHKITGNEREGKTMTHSDKIKSTKADEKYGKGNWHWSDECGGDCKTAHHICSSDCRCPDCADFDC